MSDFEVVGDMSDGDRWAITHREEWYHEPCEKEVNWKDIKDNQPDLFDELAADIEAEMHRQTIKMLIEMRKEHLKKEDIWNSLVDICKTRV